MVELKNIYTQIKDGDWIESKDQSTEGIRLVQTGNIGIGNYLDKDKRAKFVSDKTFEDLKCTEIFEGDILISRLPSPVGRACLVPKLSGRAITAVDCTILRVNKDICIPKYFVYYTMSNMYLNQINRFVVGTTRARISRKNLEGIKIFLPQIDTQNKIVEVLDKAQRLIDKRKEQIDALDELVKSRFIEMFGDPITNNKGWNTCELREGIKEIKYGTSTPPVFSEEGIPFIRATNIKLGRIVKNDMKYISQDEASKIEKCKLELGDTIVVRSGANTGDNTYVTEEYVGAYGGYDIIVKLVSDKFNYVFINAILNSVYRDIVIQPLTRRAGQPHLNSEQIQSLVIFKPPIELQNQFADFVEQVDKLKFEMENSLKELKDNFNSLMQKAFKGELF